MQLQKVSMPKKIEGLLQAILTFFEGLQNNVNKILMFFIVLCSFRATPSGGR